MSLSNTNKLSEAIIENRVKQLNLTIDTLRPLFKPNSHILRRFRGIKLLLQNSNFRDSQVLGNLEEALNGIRKKEREKELDEAEKRQLDRDINAFIEWSDYYIMKLNKELNQFSYNDKIKFNENNNINAKLSLVESSIDNLLEHTEDRIIRLENNRQKLFNESEIERNKQLQETINTLKIAYDRSVQDISKLKTQADKLVNVMSSGGMSEKYRENADLEREDLKTWRNVAALSFGGLVIFSVVSFITCNYLGQEAQVSWQLLLSRLFVASTFAILGTYAASQANRHHKIEVTNRQIQMELASIDLYLAGLPNPTVEKIKEKLADRYFGQFSNYEIKDEHPIPYIELIREALGKVDLKQFKEILEKTDLKRLLEILPDKAKSTAK